jgi:hypothetical protein
VNILSDQGHGTFVYFSQDQLTLAPLVSLPNAPSSLIERALDLGRDVTRRQLDWGILDELYDEVEGWEGYIGIVETHIKRDLECLRHQLNRLGLHDIEPDAEHQDLRDLLTIDPVMAEQPLHIMYTVRERAQSLYALLDLLGENASAHKELSDVDQTVHEALLVLTEPLDPQLNIASVTLTTPHLPLWKRARPDSWWVILGHHLSATSV